MALKTIDYLKEILRNISSKHFDVDFLERFLCADSVMEKPGSPEEFLAGFAFNRAKLRLDATRKNSKVTHGLEELLKFLSTFDQEKKIQFFNLENDQYTGTCYVYDGQVLGYEFVLKTGTKSLPGLHPNL